jgi:hypothetical protein
MRGSPDMVMVSSSDEVPPNTGSHTGSHPLVEPAAPAFQVRTIGKMLPVDPIAGRLRARREQERQYVAVSVRLGQSVD